MAPPFRTSPTHFVHFRITSDANTESGVGDIVDKLSGPAKRYFAEKDYGAGLSGVVVVLMCRDATLNLKRRLRLARKEKKLFMDDMLDLEQMRRVQPELRKAIVADRLLHQIPEVIEKYAVKNFDTDGFLADLRSWIVEGQVNTPVTSEATH